MDCDDENSYDYLQKVIDEADSIVLDMLPSKSKSQYIAVYQKFSQWRQEKHINEKNMCEEVLFVYLRKLFDENKLNPPTVWSRYSMIKTTLLTYKNINIKSWEKVFSFMKKQAKGYCPKKAMIFSANDITNFCTHAPNETYR